MKANLAQIFRNQAKRYGNRLAMEKRRNGRWEGWSWQEYYENARAVGLGLYSLGIRKGDRVAILSENRLEWVASDMGSLGIGACMVPLYTTVPGPEIAYIIGNSESRIFIAENKAVVAKTPRKSRVSPPWRRSSSSIRRGATCPTPCS